MSKHSFGSQHDDVKADHPKTGGGCLKLLLVAVAIFLLSGPVIYFGGSYLLTVWAFFTGFALAGIGLWAFTPTRRAFIDMGRSINPDSFSVANMRMLDTEYRAWVGIVVVVSLVILGTGVALAVVRRRQGGAFNFAPAWVMFMLMLIAPLFLIGYVLGSLTPKGDRVHSNASHSSHVRVKNSSKKTAHNIVGSEEQRLTFLSRLAQASPAPSTYPGGHVGFNAGVMTAASARGGVLVIGPPGSGKTSGIIVPSVWLAPSACVASSIKTDLMDDTIHVRTRIGRCWHFDPGAVEPTHALATQVRWSPLTSVHSWADARRIAGSITAPLVSADKGEGSHFIDQARAWLECLLYAAYLGKTDIGTVATWVQAAGQDEGALEPLAFLLEAELTGDEDAAIVRAQLDGLLITPDRERGSIVSTLTRSMRIYQSSITRKLGADPNFDIHAFVRSNDTLYITASPDRAGEYAPLLVGLLEEIRYAVYARSRAQRSGGEPMRPHVTFVLDEANNTAPIPLPAIISEAGGQGLHLVVGIQDLSRAKARWGAEANGFLTLFATKVILPGIIENDTLSALSNAAGEFDRTTTSVSTEQTLFSLRERGQSSSVTRTKVLHEGDIASIELGKSLLFVGAQWQLMDVQLHFNSPAWNQLRTMGSSV